jgi:hypothetical protein
VGSRSSHRGGPTWPGHGRRWLPSKRHGDGGAPAARVDERTTAGAEGIVATQRKGGEGQSGACYSRASAQEPTMTAMAAASALASSRAKGRRERARK